jgi:hypothetical protein
MPKKNDTEKELIGNYRSFTPSTYKEEKDDKGNVTQRCIRATFATEDSVCVFDRESGDLIMERLLVSGMQLPSNRQLPLFDSHDRWEGSQSVRGSCRNIEATDTGTAETDVFFSSLANDEATLAREGHLTDLSVGYRTFSDRTIWIEPGQRAMVSDNGKQREFTNDSNMRCAVRTTWQPYEISTTPIGADARCKFRDQNSNNKQREATMPNEVIDGNGKTQPTAAPAQPQFNEVAIREASRKEGAEAERARIDEIMGTCRHLNIEDSFVKKFIEDGTSSVSAREAIIREAQRKMTEKAAPPAGSNLTTGADETDKFRNAAIMGMSIRNGIPISKFKEKEVEIFNKSELRSVDSLQKLARVVLERGGMRNTWTLDNHEVADMILGGGFRGTTAQGTGDFPYILAAAVNKFLMKGYDEIPTTYQQWVGRQPLNDFKQNKLVTMFNFSDLDRVPEGDNFKWGKFPEKGEYAQLVKFGKAYIISYEALVNDDKNAFSTIPAKIGNAVPRMKERCTYHYLFFGNLDGVETTYVGPTMNEDSKAFFHADHSNILTTAAPSTAALAAARKALRSMTLPTDGPSKKQYTLAQIKYILAGEERWSEWQKILGSPAAYLAADGATQQANPAIINPFASMGIQLITTPYLDEYNTTASQHAWYAVADATQAQTITMCTLAGQEAPQLRSGPTEIGMARGICWDIMDVFVLAAADYRGALKNAGA